MSVKLMAKVWEDADITNRCTLLVLLTLADQANDKGFCWPSVDTIARNARCSVRTVFDEIANLTALGKLRVVSGGGSHKTNTYRVYPDPNPAIPAGLLANGTLQSPQGSEPTNPAIQRKKPCNPARQIAPQPSGIIIQPPEDPPADAGREELIEGWVAQFKAHFGQGYSFTGGRDGKAVNDLLRRHVPIPEILAMARRAWARAKIAPRSFNCEQAFTIHGLNNYWNQITAELHNGIPQKSNPRLAGVASGVVNYGEAAKRKMERQMVETQNRLAQQAKANGT